MESLLSFTELDIGKVAVALRCISDDLESLDRERMTNAMVRLGALAEMHSFFRVLYAKWFYLHSVGFKNNGEKVTCALDELRSLSEELPLYQKQIQRFFELVLDIDKAGREPSRQVMRYYHFDQPDQPSDPELFPFRLLTTRFEPVDGDTCAPVLYANTVADMISFLCRPAWSAASPCVAAKTADGTSPRRAASARSTATAHHSTVSPAAARWAHSNSGR